MGSGSPSQVSVFPLQCSVPVKKREKVDGGSQEENHSSGQVEDVSDKMRDVVVGGGGVGSNGRHCFSIPKC